MFTILQTGFHYSATEGYGFGGSYTLAIMLMVAVAVVGMIVQMRLKTVTRYYSEKPSPRGMTGRDIAEKMLHDHGIYNVAVTHVQGHLTDHFDPKTNVIRLSDSVYDSTSVASIGVACHEAGHAVQYAQNYGPIKLRAAIIPVTNIGSKLAMPLILLGILFSYMGDASYWLVYAGIACFGLSLVFQLITLPVEFNASRRAMQAIEGANILTDEEQRGARKTLTAAAMTYVAATAVALMQLLRLILIFGGRRRND